MSDLVRVFFRTLADNFPILVSKSESRIAPGCQCSIAASIKCLRPQCYQLRGINSDYAYYHRQLVMQSCLFFLKRISRISILIHEAGLL